MSGVDHTPGPWLVGEWNAHSLQIPVTHRDGGPVAAIWGGNEEASANAHVTAAAPVLLEALQRLVGEELGGDAREPRNNHETYRTQITWADRAFARAALAKARGEAVHHYSKVQDGGGRG